MILTNFHLTFFLSLFKAVFLLTNANNETSKNFVECEEGWSFFDDQCYTLGGNASKATWLNASQQCEELGAKLASIHSKELNDFLTFVVLGEIKKSAWIGLMDMNNKDQSYRRQQPNISWEDGSPFDYENWAEGEPSPNHKHGYEGCGELMFTTETKRMGKWNDVSCGKYQAYICEKSSNETVKTPDKLFCSANDGGGRLFHKSCFHIISEPKSWNDAQQHCQVKFSGNLVTIRDFPIDAFLNYIISDSENEYWIGIKVKKNQPLKWNSQWNVGYNNFNKSLEDLPDEACILRENETQWISASCAEKHPFICEKSNDTFPVLPTVEGVSCPKANPEWMDIGGGFCYYFNTDSHISWYSALEKCMKRGGTLAKIRSKEQEELFQNLLQYKKWAFYIGLTSIPSFGRKFVWTDLSKLSYRNWAPGEPNLPSEMCAEFISSQMKWNDIHCNKANDYTGYICEVEKSDPKQLQIAEIGERNISRIYEKHMLHLTNAATLLLLRNSTNTESDDLTEEKPHGHSSTPVIIAVCVVMAFFVVSVGVLGYCFRHWIREKTSKLTSVHYDISGSSKCTETSPIILNKDK